MKFPARLVSLFVLLLGPSVDATATSLTYFLDSQCTKLKRIRFTLDSSCAVSTVAPVCNANGPMWYKISCVSDAVNSTRTAFGSSPFVLVTQFTNDVCLVTGPSQRADAYLADDSCVRDNCVGSDPDMSCGEKTTLNADGSATIRYYGDSLCATIPGIVQVPPVSLGTNSCVNSKMYSSSAIVTGPTAVDKLTRIITNQETKIAQLKADNDGLAVRLTALTSTQKDCSVMKSRVAALATTYQAMNRDFVTTSMDRSTVPAESKSSWWSCSQECVQAEAAVAVGNS